MITALKGFFKSLAAGTNMKTTQRKIFIMLFAIWGLAIISQGQSISKRALFLGNSYTAVNNLPQMVANVANSSRDTLIFDSNTPGGYTLMDHSTNPASLTKIASGNWDYVVLQEQSQLPSLPITQVEAEVFPYARALDSIINSHNPCAETAFYMTWGRKNGDAQFCPSWPPVCTYSGMDSLLNLRYRMMAESNHAILSPVGAVWKYIITNFPSIELYQADESHPSVAGTYAAACCFYTSFFRKDPTHITFNSTLSSDDAANIRTAAKIVVFDSLMKWHIGEYDPLPDFTYDDLGNGNIAFTNHSLNATTYFWEFGDESNSLLQDPAHTYSQEGDYVVKLFASKCGVIDSTEQTIKIVMSGVHEQNIPALNIYPNPATDIFTLVADERLTGSVYQIFNSEGKIILNGKIYSEQTIIDLKGFPAGVYLIKTDHRSQRTLKVIKE